MILLYATYCGDPEGMMVFLACWFAALLYQRSHLSKREHSRYNGAPVVAMKLPWLKGKEMLAKKFEPYIVLAAGLLLYPLSPAVGGFVMAGFVSIRTTLMIDEKVNQLRLQQLRDAQLENEWLAEQWRNQSEEWK
jgi:hypothetical protein